jgi:hypothetical protein
MTEVGMAVGVEVGGGTVGVGNLGALATSGK